MEELRPIKLGKSNNRYSSRSKSKFKKLLPLLIVIFVLLSLSYFLINLKGSTTISRFNILGGSSLKSTDDKVNILFLGIAGGVHDGSNLTDTIMVASYNLKTNQLYLFSIPRDLWLPALKSKANAAYEIGMAKNDGLGMTKTVMGNILGIPIHYALRVDFRGFVTAIDALGGVDVIVDKQFDDYLYPIQGKEDDMCGSTEKEMDFSADDAKKLNIDPGKQKVLILPDGQIATDSAIEDNGIKYFSCRYEHISFDKGLMKMNGAIALAYVRSRHGTNGQGSDFARSKRQQQVIEAARKKILSANTLMNPQKISELISTFGKSIDTDIPLNDILEFYNLSKKLDKTHSFVLDDSPKIDLPNNRTSLLVHPPAADYGGAYVLISQDDDFAIVQGYVKKILSGEITDYEATATARPRN